MEKENWVSINIEILELKFIQIGQLKTAVDFPKRSGEINPFLGKPLSLKDFVYGKARSISMEEKSENILGKHFHS